MTALSEVKVGGSGVLESLELPEEISDHLAHLGFLPGASFEVLRRAPAGDPTVYRIDGIEVGLRRETASHILIEAAAPVETAAPVGTEKTQTRR
ncbi:MAG: FeoA family protein [Janthinobacterium lividum]